MSFQSSHGNSAQGPKCAIFKTRLEVGAEKSNNTCQLMLTGLSYACGQLSRICISENVQAAHSNLKWLAIKKRFLPRKDA